MQGEDETSQLLRSTYVIDDAKANAAQSRVFGWLWKRGRKDSLFSSAGERKRWLTLRPDTCDIAYYESKDSKEEMPKGTIDLRKVTKIKFEDARVEHGGKGNKKQKKGALGQLHRWCFQVTFDLLLLQFTHIILAIFAKFKIETKFGGNVENQLLHII